MSSSRTARALAVFAATIALVLVVSSLTLQIGGRSVDPILLGIGVALLAASLVFLQLSFWREGDEKGHAKPSIEVVSPAPPAATRASHLWEGMEATRRIMRRKQEESDERQRREEESRLGLSAREQILFMEDPSSFFSRPLALGSALFLFVSQWGPNRGVRSFALLVLALGGLLFLTVMKGQSRYYLTNFRMMVRKKPWKGPVRWSTLHYGDVKGWSFRSRLGWTRICLQGTSEKLDISGPQSRIEIIVHILRERLPGPTTLPD